MVTIFRRKPAAQVGCGTEIVTSEYSQDKVFLSPAEKNNYQKIADLSLLDPPALPSGTRNYTKEEFLKKVHERINYWQQSMLLYNIRKEVDELKRIEREISEQ